MLKKYTFAGFIAASNMPHALPHMSGALMHVRHPYQVRYAYFMHSFVWPFMGKLILVLLIFGVPFFPLYNVKCMEM